MRPYRLRAALLLFLVLNLTACYTWQGVATTRPIELIKATQPDRVRVLKPDGTQVELENPSFEGDQLVGAVISIPVADVLQIQIRNFNLGRTILAGFGVFMLATPFFTFLRPL